MFSELKRNISLITAYYILGLSVFPIFLHSFGILEYRTDKCNETSVRNNHFSVYNEQERSTQFYTQFFLSFG
jgi:hypothetical protein